MEPLRTFYTAVKALAQGSEAPRRPPLPEELATYVCRLAEFQLEHVHESPGEDEDIHVKVTQGRFGSVMFKWFQTGPLSQRTIKHIENIQLVTRSRYEGGPTVRTLPRSWYEFQIIRPGLSEIENRELGSWASHDHYFGPGAEDIKGAVFDSSHEMLRVLQEEDVLKVVMSVVSVNLRKLVPLGAVRVFTLWKPSAEMLSLMYAGTA